MEENSSVAVLVMLSVFSFVGTVGNSLVLYIYANKKTKTTAGVFIMCLAGTDLFTCLVIVPYTEIVIFFEYKLFHDVICKAYMFLITFNVPFSAFIMCAIAIDRFFCICYPFLHALNLRRARIIILCLLSLACLCGLITALLHGIIPPMEMTSHDRKTTNTSSALITTNDTKTELLNIVTLEDQSDSNTTSLKGSNPCEYNLTCQNIVMSENGTHESMEDLTGLCAPNNDIIDSSFAEVYQKIYSSFYLLSFVLVLILYALIYRSIWKHRAKKRKRKRSSLYPAGVGIMNTEL